MLKPNLQWDGIVRWDLWEVTRSGGGALMAGTGALTRGRVGEKFPPGCEGTERTQLSANQNKNPPQERSQSTPQSWTLQPPEFWAITICSFSHQSVVFC